MRLLMFAYGSNMLSARLRERVPSAKAIGIGRLPGHALRWHKRGSDGSGKCDIEKTGQARDVVWGVLIELDAAEKPALDRAEGLGKGYVERRVSVITDHGSVKASAYVGTGRDPAIKPYDWYKDLVIAGAREHGLPEPYLRQLEHVQANRDPNPARSALNDKLLRSVQPGK